MSDERMINLDEFTRKRPSPFDSGRKPPGADPTPENPHQRARPQRLPKMGEQPRLPKPELELPVMTDNPMANASEPATIDTQRPPAKRDYAGSTARRVVPAEIDELIGWGLPRFQHRFPRCTPQSIYPLLMEATNGGRFLYVRTDSAQGLWIAERTPWEPELAVYDAFVVKKRLEANDEERDAIYRAGLRWAEEIGAVTFQYGASTGVKLDAVAAKIGFDFPIYGYIKKLR